MRQQQSAGLILFRADENGEKIYLLLQYTNGGHWDFPKGKIEDQETKADAALRELKEETGISECSLINDNLPLHFEETITYTFIDFDGQQTQKTVYFFIAQTNNTHPILSHEHTNFVWLTYDQALKKLTYSNAQALLTKADTFLEKCNI